MAVKGATQQAPPLTAFFEREMTMQNKLKCELYNDSMQGWKCYPIQKAQLIIADVPYNVGTNFYASNPVWYKGGE